MNKFDHFYRLHYQTCLAEVTCYSDIIQNKTILDIGSNIGLFSLAIVNTLTYKSIHLFEPSKELISYSQTLLSKFQNIYYNNVGLGDNLEQKVLYKNLGDNIGWNTVLTKDPNQHGDFYNYMETEVIDVVCLDNYYKNITDIGFIKIDVEGYERQVIDGSLCLIEKFKPFLLIEVGWGMSHPEWDLNKLTYNKLFDIGYETINFHSSNTENVLFIPK